MNIIKMLPFLDESSKKDLVNAIINREIDMKDLNVIALLPFLEDDEIEKILLFALDEKIHVNPIAILPFTSEAALNRLIEKIQRGEIEGIGLESIAPFLNEEQIRCLFKKEFNKMKIK
ncbi:MAG: hypothetical protein WCT17_01930 [Bacilli bacterium]